MRLRLEAQRGPRTSRAALKRQNRSWLPIWLRVGGAAWLRTSTAAARRQQRSWLLMRLRLRGTAMAAHKYCGGEAAAAELAAHEAASERRSDGRAQAGGVKAAAAELAVDEAASERRSDGRAQVVRRRGGSSGAGCRHGCA